MEFCALKIRIKSPIEILGIRFLYIAGVAENYGSDLLHNSESQKI